MTHIPLPMFDHSDTAPIEPVWKVSVVAVEQGFHFDAAGNYLTRPVRGSWFTVDVWPADMSKPFQIARTATRDAADAAVVVYTARLAQMEKESA